MELLRVLLTIGAIGLAVLSGLFALVDFSLGIYTILLALFFLCAAHSD